MTRIDTRTLQVKIGVRPDGVFGTLSRKGLREWLTNSTAPRLTRADMVIAASDLNVDVAVIQAVVKVEAPRGAFDAAGLMSLLYERHIFAQNTRPNRVFNATHPRLSGPALSPGQYGTYGEQIVHFGNACALDPDAAFKAVSFGAFQILGENAIMCGYKNALDMVDQFRQGEAAQLEGFVRFVRATGLEDELRACRGGNPDSCRPFVSGYNGRGYEKNSYHVKLSQAISTAK